MDIGWSAAEETFRAEVRDWLEANKPPPADALGRLGGGGRRPSRLGAARCSTPAGRWSRGPGRYGGRDASLWEWLIFEEEYFRAGLPQRVAQNGIFLLAPSLFEFGTPEQQDRLLPRMASHRGPVVPGLVGAGQRQRPRLPHEPGDPRRGRRRVAAQRPEDLDDPGRLLHPPVRPLPHRPERRAAPGPHLSAGRPPPAGGDGAARPQARRRRGLRRGVLRRRLRARRRRPRRGRTRAGRWPWPPPARSGA